MHSFEYLIETTTLKVFSLSEVEKVVSKLS